MGEASSYISTQMKMLEETKYYEIYQLFEKAKGNSNILQLFCRENHNQ